MREAISSLNLDCKIWKFEELLTDFVCAGFTSENRFDQLFSGNYKTKFYKFFRFQM